MVDILASIPALLPLFVAAGGCFALVRAVARRRGIQPDVSLEMAGAAVVFGLLVLVAAELASLIHGLRRAVMLAGWGGLAVGLWWLSCQIRVPERSVKPAEAARGGGWVGWGRAAYARFRGLGGDLPEEGWWYLAGAVLIAGFLLGQALVYSTTNWDALTYHLPRLLHWIQAGSVEPYATPNTRQVEFGPWTAYLNLQVLLLTQQDRWLNLVQWAAMIACVVVLGGVADELWRSGAHGSVGGDNAARAKRLRHAFAALVVVTLPIGITESVNPQTDYVAAMWMACLARLALAVHRTPDSLWPVAGCALAAGLGALSKATVYLYAAPLILVGSIWMIRRIGHPWRLAARALLFAVLFLAVNGAHGWRNWRVFGSFLGSDFIHRVERNDPITCAGTLSVLIRNLALHSDTGIPPLSGAVQRGFNAAHGLTGRRLDDPATTFFFLPQRPEAGDVFAVTDSHASCFYHGALLLAAVGTMMLRPRGKARGAMVVVLCGLGFVLFSAMLRYQYWHARLHLVWFVLLAPVVAALAVEHWRPWCRAAAGAVLFLVAVVTIGVNESRPMFRLDFLRQRPSAQHLTAFAPRHNRALEYAAERIIARSSQRVGLALGWNEPEYVLWRFLREGGFTGVLHHVGVTNETARLTDPSWQPDVVVQLNGSLPADLEALLPRAESLDPVEIRFPAATGSPPAAAGIDR